MPYRLGDSKFDTTWLGGKSENSSCKPALPVDLPIVSKAKEIEHGCRTNTKCMKWNKIEASAVKWDKNAHRIKQSDNDRMMSLYSTVPAY